MAEYLLPKARCVETGQTVKSQDLTNNRFTLGQRSQAQEVADQLAVKMQQRTRLTWQGFVQQYKPSSFNRS
jgi:hypothetical protein